MTVNSVRYAVLGVFALVSAGVAQNATPPRFDAVSLRVAPDILADGDQPHGMIISRGTVDFKWVQLYGTILRAYDKKFYQVPSASWMMKMYSGRATFPPSTPLDQVPVMLRTMLQERFALKCHTETRMEKVWLLEQAPGGAKLTRASDHPAAAATGAPSFFRPEPGRTMKVSTDPNKAHLMMNKGKIPLFCNQLSTELKRAVLDRTGLQGEYDIDVEVALAYPKVIPPPTLAPTPPVHRSDMPPLVLGPALKKLGLKLRPAKEPMEILIVDSGQSFPSGS